MCGIFGLIGHLEKNRALSCLDTLAHRGPDGQGLWQQPGITLGHRRLAILDLSDNARQPMADSTERYVIVFNGEIYNFVEIRAELEKKGHRFKTDSDTEVLLMAFIEWGEACLNRLNGMWAFALWDKHKQALFLARDRFGKKPLYYAQLSQNRFAFASEMKAIAPLLDVLRPNAELVRDTTRIFQYEATSECVIEGIKRFPAGYSGWVKDNHLQIRRWWNTLDHLPCVPTKYEEQVAMFREVFLDACRLRMRSDVPLGTALSGGLDSSATITAMSHIAQHGKTQRMGQNWQHAFIASFPGTPLDETRYAKMVTNHIGIEPVVIEIDPLKEIAKLDRYFYLFEDLYITSPIPFMQTYAAVKAHGVSVTLDGHGADELFGGYPHDFIVALEDAAWNIAQSRDIVQAYYDIFGDSAQLNRGMPSQWSYLVSQYKAYAIRRAKKGVKKLLGRKSAEDSVDSKHSYWNKLDHLNKRLYISTHETILPTLLRNYDRYSMANGVEIRMPFMDHRVVSMAFALPWTAKVRGGFSKAIVRDAMSNYLPPEVAYRKSKIGFNSPIVDWMQGPLKDYLSDIMASRSFKECELINAPEVDKQVRYVMNNPEAKFIDGERAWTMMTPYLWERSVIKGNGRA